ncbi:hypothetical protein [Bacillus testis]|uniref:hypothetical protein n=1 Tax=Bacillus testis TaxID=1622072 RepID=UPI00067EE657|nr:hypothetical protein [Bacillus testis]
MEKYQSMTLTRGNLQVSFKHLNEGYYGEYNPSNILDCRLLRFFVLTYDEGSGKFEEIKHTSHLTFLRVSTPDVLLKKALEMIMDAVVMNMKEGNPIEGVCKAMSFINTLELEEALTPVDYQMKPRRIGFAEIFQTTDPELAQHNGKAFEILRPLAGDESESGISERRYEIILETNETLIVPEEEISTFESFELAYL